MYVPDVILLISMIAIDLKIQWFDKINRMLVVLNVEITSIMFCMTGAPLLSWFYLHFISLEYT